MNKKMMMSLVVALIVAPLIIITTALYAAAAIPVGTLRELTPAEKQNVTEDTTYITGINTNGTIRVNNYA